ncbi:MAG: hypothetical protein HFJ55_03355 [Clostridia bacterium]|jgi:hypothetical protein|nr:hypothetical protein [Clostridia bacterium]
MSLTRAQKHAIRKIRIYKSSYKERNGKPYYNENGEEKEFVIPQFGEILKEMFEKIKGAGFSEVERCSPQKANCIIRIFQDLHHKYSYDMCYNIYGANCYTNIDGRWQTGEGLDSYNIRYGSHKFRVVFYQDEYMSVDADFADFYVKVK